MAKITIDGDSGNCPMGNASCTIDNEIEILRSRIERLEAQANTDPLTHLFNVRHLRYSLEQEMERTRRTHQPTTFILLDVDHFKKFNDVHGHLTGDKVLIHLATVLKNAVRKIDIPCRYGGEEFAIVLPSTPLLVGIQVAERIRKTVESKPLQEEDKSLSITVSVGVDTFTHQHMKGMEDLISSTDKLLYKAKNNGRNQVQFTPQKNQDKAQVSQAEKSALFDDLDRAPKTD